MRPERLMSGGTGEYAVGTIIPERSPVSLSRARREEFIHALRPLEHSIRDAGHIRYGTGISFPVGPFTRVTFLDTSRRGRYADRLFIHPPKKHPTVIVTERRMRGKRRKRHVIRSRKTIQSFGQCTYTGQERKKSNRPLCPSGWHSPSLAIFLTRPWKRL